MFLLFIIAFVEIALMGVIITWDVLHPKLMANDGRGEKEAQKAGATYAAALPHSHWYSHWSVSRG